MFYPVPMEAVTFEGGYHFECERDVEQVEFAIRENDNGIRDLIREDVTARIDGKFLTIYIPKKYDTAKYIQLNINTTEKEV